MVWQLGYKTLLSHWVVSKYHPDKCPSRFLSGSWTFVFWTALKSALSLPILLWTLGVYSGQKKTFWSVKQSISWSFSPCFMPLLNMQSYISEGILSFSWAWGIWHFPLLVSYFSIWSPFKVSRQLDASFKQALALAILPSCPLHTPSAQALQWK